MAGFKKATKLQSKLRIALCGPAGSGKSWTGLSILCSMAEEAKRMGHNNGKVAGIDSERRSLSLYADHFDFDVMDLDSHSPQTYIKAIELAEREGYSFLLIDSLTHAWSGKDGALEQKDNKVSRGDGNDFTAWRGVSRDHNALVDAMLNCKMHLVATLRTHTEYVIEKDEKGKNAVRKVGMAPVQRKGLEYEFTAVGDLELTNLHTLKISKIRGESHGIVIGEEFERPGKDVAMRLYGWLMSGAESAPVEHEPVMPAAPQSIPPAVSDMFERINFATSLDQLKNLTGEIGVMGTKTHTAFAMELKRRYSSRKTQLLKSRDEFQRIMAPEPEAQEGGSPSQPYVRGLYGLDRDFSGDPPQ